MKSSFPGRQAKKKFVAGLTASVALALALGVPAGAAQADDTATPSAAQDPLQVEVPAGVKLVVADDANHVHLLMQLSGEQDKLASSVTYANFSSGPLRLEAIRAGAAQIGAVGDVPPILAQFSGTGVRIVAAVISSGTGSQVTTAPKSGIESLADLKGKKIGINEGTAQQAILLRDLASVGLGAKDVQQVNLGIAEFPDALRADQIDAAVLKQPDRARYLASAARRGAKELANAPQGDTGLEYLYAARPALADPGQAAAVRDFVVHWYRATLWKNTHQEKWLQAYLLDDQHLKHEDAGKVLEGQGQGSIPRLTGHLVDIQRNTISILQGAGAFGGKALAARDEFDLRYADLDQDSPAARDGK